MPASFEEPQLIKKLGAVFLHQDCGCNAEAEQHDLAEVWNGVSGALFQ